MELKVRRTSTSICCMKRWRWSKLVRNNRQRVKNDSPIPLSLRGENVKNSTQKKRHHRNHEHAKMEHTSYPRLRLIERTFKLDRLWQSHVLPTFLFSRDLSLSTATDQSPTMHWRALRAVLVRTRPPP